MAWCHQAASHYLNQCYSNILITWKPSYYDVIIKPHVPDVMSLQATSLPEIFHSHIDGRTWRLKPLGEQRDVNHVEVVCPSTGEQTQAAEGNTPTKVHWKKESANLPSIVISYRIQSLKALNLRKYQLQHESPFYQIISHGQDGHYFADDIFMKKVLYFDSNFFIVCS